MFSLVDPIFLSTVCPSDLCRRPYPNHPRGCPNFGKKDGCPPKVTPFWELIDLREPVHVIWTKFDLQEHRQRMRAWHPGWTKRQLDCCLYWQPKARKNLRAAIKRYLELADGSGKQQIIVSTPEARGVDVTATMKAINIILEWPPEHWTYQIAFAGARKDPV